MLLACFVLLFDTAFTYALSSREVHTAQVRATGFRDFIHHLLAIILTAANGYSASSLEPSENALILILFRVTFSSRTLIYTTVSFPV